MSISTFAETQRRVCGLNRALSHDVYRRLFVFEVGHGTAQIVLRFFSQTTWNGIVAAPSVSAASPEQTSEKVISDGISVRSSSLLFAIARLSDKHFKVSSLFARCT